MLLRRFGRFTGGIDLPDEKAATLDKAIEPWEALERLWVPLALCPGASAYERAEPWGIFGDDPAHLTVLQPAFLAL